MKFEKRKTLKIVLLNEKSKGKIFITTLRKGFYKEPFFDEKEHSVDFIY